MSTFQVLPAIDLVEGRIVRLWQGDFGRETRYPGDPVDTARAFADAGATWVHVVDLDGARAGEPRQLDLVATIAAAVRGRLLVELGGGLRTLDAVDRALASGIERVALGTAAVRDPGFARRVVERHGPDRVVASVDVRGGLALGEGWRAGSPGVPAVEAVVRLADAGITTFEVTAIERDGLLEGPDLGLLRSLVALARGVIVASGGIASLADLLAVRAAGCRGAIVGRAIYEGRIELDEAVRAVGSPSAPPP